jgi:hypothetical protein
VIHVRLRARGSAPVPVSAVGRPPERAIKAIPPATPAPARAAGDTLGGFKRIFGH